MSARDWSQVVEFTFPSGKTATIRKVRPEDLLVMGQVPNILAAVFFGQKTEVDPDNLTPEQATEWLEFLNTLCVAAFVNPKVLPYGEEPDYEKDEISIMDIDIPDREALFAFCTEAITNLEKFRDSEESMEVA